MFLCDGSSYLLCLPFLFFFSFSFFFVVVVFIFVYFLLLVVFFLFFFLKKKFRLVETTQKNENSSIRTRIFSANLYWWFSIDKSICHSIMFIFLHKYVCSHAVDNDQRHLSNAAYSLLTLSHLFTLLNVSVDGSRSIALLSHQIVNNHRPNRSLRE
jgi:hypothetical protein